MNQMDITKKGPANWTSQNIADFWNWQSQYKYGRNNYFTAVMSAGIVRYLKNKGLLNGKLLDYGCGSGHLLELLGKEKKTECYGLEFSADSAKETERRTKNFPNIKKVVLADSLPTSFEDNMFDTIVLIETIEHLPDDILHQTFRELYRILKQGGSIFITTPFNEELEKHLIFCPFCKTEFHHMQHMQSFTRERLIKLMSDHGFSVVFCSNIDIEKLKLGRIKYFLKRTMVTMAEIAGIKETRTDKTPNLVALVSKV